MRESIINGNGNRKGNGNGNGKERVLRVFERFVFVLWTQSVV